MDLSNEYCGAANRPPPKPPLPSPLNHELNLPRTLVLSSRCHRFIGTGRSAGYWPDQSSHLLCFRRIMRSTLSGRHQRRGPDLGRGLFLFRRLRQVPSTNPNPARNQPHRHLFPSKIRDVKLESGFSPTRLGVELGQQLLECRFSCFVSGCDSVEKDRRLPHRA